LATAQACKKIEADLDVARGRRDAEVILTRARKDANKKVDALEKKLKACKKTNSQRAGIIYAKGLARAAADARVKFALKPGFEKKAGAFKTDDVVRAALKVKKDTDTVAAGKKFAKQHDLDEAAQAAGIVETLNASMKGAQAGFITAQIAATIVDIVGLFVSLGAYAAAAPAVHGAIAAGQKITIEMIKKDIATAEEKYQRAVKKRRAKADLKAAEKQLKDQEAAAAALEQESKARIDAAKSSEEPPWHTRKEVIAAGVLLTAATLGFAWSRRS